MFLEGIILAATLTGDIEPISTNLPPSTVTNLPPVTIPWTNAPPPLNPLAKSPFSEDQIRRTIERLSYIDNGAVVRLGLKHLGQILEKEDLSDRDDLKGGLLHTMSADGEVYKNLGYDTRVSAGRSLGISKLVPRSVDELILLLKGKEPEPARVAIVEYSAKTKTSPPDRLIDTLKELKLYSTLVEIALSTADKQIITYLVGLAKEQNNFDSLYGLNAEDAAAEVVKHYRAHLETPPAPSDLTATLTTYRSVQLSWKDNSENEYGFIIFRSVGDAPLAEIARVPGNQIYHADNNLEPGFTYNYKVAAFHWGIQTSESAVVSVTTTAPPDPLPNPLPQPPPLPASPTSNASIQEHTRKMRIEIDGRIHQGIVEALIDMLKLGPTPVDVAILIGHLLEEQYTKALFDADSLSSSLGLFCVDALRTRANYEAQNTNFAENVRRANAAALRASATALEKSFMAELVVPAEKP